MKLNEKGQIFYADYAKPDGLCDEAWKAIYQYVFALSHGAYKRLTVPVTYDILSLLCEYETGGN